MSNQPGVAEAGATDVVNGLSDMPETRQRRKRPDTPPSDDSSETPTAEEEENEESQWKSVTDYGVASDRNARFRRTMEDAHIAVDEIVGEHTGYFGVYDGHGGRGAVNF